MISNQFSAFKIAFSEFSCSLAPLYGGIILSMTISTSGM